MFSANPSISPIGLKPSDVANGVGQGEQGRTWGGTRSDYGERGRTRGEWGRTGGERGWIGGERGRTGGNGVGLGGTGSNWGGTASDWAGTWVGLARNGVRLEGERDRTMGNGGRIGRERRSDLWVGLGGSDWSIRGGGQLIWPHSLPQMHPDHPPLREARVCRVHGARRAL